jgi:isopentenyl-diphosphate Delta-isomerase
VSEERPSNPSHRKRKEDHLRISLNESVQSEDITTGFENYAFIHEALPEIALTDVDLSIRLFDKQLDAPIIVSSMVGGIPEAAPINRNLAKAVQKLHLGMGVGSQRCLIGSPETVDSFRIRELAPDILLFANLGAVQLNYGYGVEECLEIIRTIDADALILHLNPLQEALQPEGNINFTGLLDKIKQLCRELTVPVMVKEIGYGISAEVAMKLVDSGVAGLDVAGAGGTSWSEVERRRTADKLGNKVAAAFSGWGIPTTESILAARRGAPNLPLIASGGIRSGLDIAKSIALGADAAGMAWPLLKAAVNSETEVIEKLEEMIQVLRIAMFCIGAKNISILKYSPFLHFCQ